MEIKLPPDLVNAQKVCRHLNAYQQGYDEKQFDLNFIKVPFYADSLNVEKTIKNYWNDRLQTPQHMISCCFNLAGLQDKRNPWERPSWHECLKTITQHSAMTYADDIEEKTAALCALNILDMLKSEGGNFDYRLKTSVEQAQALLNTINT